MCILTDSEIISMATSGLLISDGFSGSSVTPNGYDLRIQTMLLPETAHETSHDAEIPPHSWFVVSTLEKITLPGNISAQLWIRSSYARKGLFGSFGKVDAGFSGTLTLSFFNASSKSIRLTGGERVAQIVFERLCSNTDRDYASRSGNYQNQAGITLEPPERAPVRTSSSGADGKSLPPESSS
ncbi:MAG: dCTP deaminase [Methanomassiliicoccales archaeon]|nr:dCTP deaminase [Methanomassiliicoccales archaeon]